MFKITGNTIEITRGDKATIEFSIEGYTFGLGDVVRFRVYSKKGLNIEAHINKVINVMNMCKVIRINLSSEETKIGEMENKPITYWYEIELNGNDTIIGYDDIGAKEFILYPEGYDTENETIEEYYGDDDDTSDDTGDGDSSGDSTGDGGEEGSGDTPGEETPGEGSPGGESGDTE